MKKVKTVLGVPFTAKYTEWEDFIVDSLNVASVELITSKENKILSGDSIWYPVNDKYIMKFDTKCDIETAKRFHENIECVFEIEIKSPFDRNLDYDESTASITDPINQFETFYTVYGTLIKAIFFHKKTRNVYATVQFK